jgi:hypothetical protein
MADKLDESVVVRVENLVRRSIRDTEGPSVTMPPGGSLVQSLALGLSVPLSLALVPTNAVVLFIDEMT